MSFSCFQDNKTKEDITSLADRTSAVERAIQDISSEYSEIHVVEMPISDLASDITTYDINCTVTSAFVGHITEVSLIMNFLSAVNIASSGSSWAAIHIANNVDYYIPKHVTSSMSVYFTAVRTAKNVPLKLVIYNKNLYLRSIDTENIVIEAGDSITFTFHFINEYIYEE